MIDPRKVSRLWGALKSTRTGDKPISLPASDTESVSGGKGLASIQQIRDWIEKPWKSTKPKFPASRSYRYLARQIEGDLGRSENGRGLIFTSPGSLELTTEALLMFAHVLQDELGATVLLLDATLRVDGIGARLGHADTPGFMDLLYDDKYKLEELILPTKRKSIHVLPAGSASSNGFLPLKPEHLEPYFKEARQRFDYVLVQQGSIIADTRYLLLTPLVDLVILLAEEGGTLIEELETCQKLFRDYQIANTRLVLSVPS